jgi:double-strand break repair protein AddB, alphaproteobacterial type
MSDRRKKKVFTLPPGLPFLRETAQALLDGRLTEGFRFHADDPLALAKVTIFVPTRRAARELRSEFVELLGGRAAILPIIKPLGETEEDDGYFGVENPTLLDLAPPISGTARLIELARLILAWRNQLPEIVRSIHSDTPLVAPASPADAIWLARALTELIDAVETEEGDWRSLDKVQAGDFASWWQLTLEFLKIATAFWPERLKELNRSSPAYHRNAMLRAEADRILASTNRDPVIVAGSTGSIPAAARLISAVASLPNGVVVLPGLDQIMPLDHWRLVGAQSDGLFSDPTSRSHPQYGLYHLIDRLGLEREEIEALNRAEPALADRAEILSRALAPAAATDSWTEWREDFPAERFNRAFAGVSLIEAANEREEAAAIAIALRLALEEPGSSGESRAALVTPDRNLAKRVRAELARFDIMADDTAGTPLSATDQGTLLQIMLEACLRPGDPTVIVAFLKHPLVRFGYREADFRTSVDALELLALRGGIRSAGIGELEDLLKSRMEAHSGDRHPPEWRKSLPEDAASQAAMLASTIRSALEPLTSAEGLTLPIAEWAERSAHALEAVCADERGNLATLWGNEAGEKLASLIEEIMQTNGMLEADGVEWIDIVTAFSVGEAVKPRAMRHPRVFIFGTLEARLQNVDTIVLGGLNEGSWPSQTINNPFLSRTMKTDMGLEPPERRTGQLAHDFEMASGTRNLIYSRSLRQGNAPTVASRWLQRLLALGGPEFSEQLRERGERYRRFVALLDKGENQQPAQRPAPKPEADLQPRQYSFSEVGRLRRDPYSIYAKRILRLDPVQPFNREPGPAERGTLYHRIVDRFVRRAIPVNDPAAEEVLSEIIAQAFAEERLPPHIDVVWRQRFVEVAHRFLAWERERQGNHIRSLTEVPAGYELSEAGIRLTGVADRIDIRPGGFADIIDYKTGSSPSPAQARSLLDPQLPLEAAALQAGAFRSAGALKPADLIYVRLRPGDRFSAETVNNELTGKGDKAKSALDLGADAIEQLSRFVQLLRSGERGFVSRLIPFMQGDLSGDYDHLARVAEWSTAESEEAGDE